MNAPTGNVTFLFTDIEGSTKLAHSLPDKYKDILERHDAILTETIESHNGFVFKKIGDAFCSAFDPAVNALLAAIEIQRNLNTANNALAKSEQVKVRIGIHTGKADYVNGDYSLNLTFSKVKKIMSAAYGGQVILSGSTYDHIVHDPDLKEISFRDLGNRLLRDIPQPVHFYQILAAGLDEDFPPLKTLDARPNNLPAQLTSFIGREDVIRKLKEILKQTRLLTITGSGGVGKTRVSLELGGDLIDEYIGGVRIAELAPLTEQSSITQTLLKVFDIRENPGITAEDTLVDYLKKKEVLIILDNCEHLISGCAKITDKILINCPGIKIIATGREALHIPAEMIYQLETLSVPDIKELPSLGSINQYESVRLFTERALEVHSDFKMTEANASAIVQICSHLDGIPLAIELAAARTSILPVENILERLKDRFGLLKTGTRSALPRQQTLRALIDWSYDMLSEKEKLLLKRLSVFSGSWTLEAAEIVCTDNKIDSFEILDLLSNLIDKSLVKVTESGDSRRYTMLETIRKYGEEKLTERTELYQKHFDYYLALSTPVGDSTDEQRIKLQKIIDAEHDNIRAALRWSIDRNDERSIYLAIEFAHYCNWIGYYNEGFETYSKILESGINLDAHQKASALMHCGGLSSMMGNFEIAEKFLSESLEYFRSVKNEKHIAECLDGLGMNDFYRGKPENSIQFYEDSLAISRKLVSKQTIANTLCNFGTLLLYLGELDLANDRLQEGLTLCRELKSIFTTARILQNLGGLQYQKGNYDEARLIYEESLGLINAIGDKNATAVVLLNLGNVYFSEKNYTKAEQMFQEGLALANAHGYSMAISHFIIKLGDLALVQNHNLKAKEFYLSSIKKFYIESDMRRLATCFFGMAKYYLAEKQFEMSAQCFGISEQIFEESKFKQSKSRLEEYKMHTEELIKILGHEKFIMFFEKGKKNSLEEAIALTEG